jgi:hypothetical protein
MCSDINRTNFVTKVFCFLWGTVVSLCWGYGFVTQTWLSDNAKEKLCRSNVTFISDRSTTAWQVARRRRIETLISGLNPPGRSSHVTVVLRSEIKVTFYVNNFSLASSLSHVWVTNPYPQHRDTTLVSDVGLPKCHINTRRVHTTAVWRNAVLQFYTGLAHGYVVNPTMLQCYNWYMDTINPTNTISTCVGLIPQPRSPTKYLWIEKSIKEGQGPTRTVEASGRKIQVVQLVHLTVAYTTVRTNLIRTQTSYLKGLVTTVMYVVLHEIHVNEMSTSTNVPSDPVKLLVPLLCFRSCRLHIHTSRCWGRSTQGISMGWHPKTGKAV